jgi:hypothetical protein
MEMNLNSTNSVVTVGKVSFYKINDRIDFFWNPLMVYDGFIIDSSNSVFIRTVAREIRGHHQPEIYLKGIFLMGNPLLRDKAVYSLIDGFILAGEDLRMAANRSQDYFLRSLDIHSGSPSGVYGAVMKKAFDLMYTRQNKMLSPIRDTHSIIGYNFPELSISFDENEEPQVLDALDWAEKEGLIWPDFQERIYVCSSCSGGFLSFREVCPHCKSSNIEGEDLVHHFPCAYIGPVSDFQMEDSSVLNCPKCNKDLHHIGVDYDKPAVINHCNNCDSIFQDVYVKAKCMNCESDMDVQYLKSRNINAYKLTKKGRLAITKGYETNLMEDELDVNFQPMDTFMSLLKYDIIREGRELGDDVLTGIYFENLNDFASQYGDFRRQTLIREIASIVQQRMNDLDYMCLEQSDLLWLAVHDVKNIEPAIENLVEEIKELIEVNLPSVKLTILFEYTHLQSVSSAENCMLDLKRKMLVE